MACAGCGGQATQAGPCRVFSFPLGKGTVDLVLRGELQSDDLKPLSEYLDFAERVVRTMVEGHDG